MSRSNAPNPSGSRKISFNVSEQYDIQDVVGEGAYGVVWYVQCAQCRPMASLD
jgi:mitogen-activated protein kinase 1/3